MADEIYTIPEKPEYREQIRKLQDSDPASASRTFNPLIQRLVENAAAHQRRLEQAVTRAEADRRYFSMDTFRLDGGIETQSLHFETQFIPERLEFIRNEDSATVSIHPSQDPIGIPWNDYGVRLDGVLAPDHDYGAANKQYVDGLLAEKQDRLTGAQGQVVGFNAQGQAVAQAAPDTGVVSFKGRKGAVTPQSGDYTAAQVGALPIAGGSMTGTLYAQRNASYTTAQVRNIYFTTSDLTAGSTAMNDGDIAIVYE